MRHADDIQWRLVSSMNLHNQHHTVLRDNELGVQCEVLTNKTNGGAGTGKARKYYFIDGDDREFLSDEELIDAYNEKFKFEGENPTHEVKYVRVVVKRELPLPTPPPPTPQLPKRCSAKRSKRR